MNERDDAVRRTIARLDAGLETLDGDTLSRLARARERALQRAAAGAATPARRPWRAALEGFSARYALVAALVCLVLFGVAQLRTGPERVDEIAEIDARILTGDLPINAYLDQKLDPWLGHSQP